MILFLARVRKYLGRGWNKKSEKRGNIFKKKEKKKYRARWQKKLGV
jgi:hypothetical protein